MQVLQRQLRGSERSKGRAAKLYTTMTTQHYGMRGCCSCVCVHVERTWSKHIGLLPPQTKTCV
eukprot:3835536-Amphidinium_carterae.1